jgi:hypothetical protein
MVKIGRPITKLPTRRASGKIRKKAAARRTAKKISRRKKK